MTKDKTIEILIELADTMYRHGQNNERFTDDELKSDMEPFATRLMGLQSDYLSSLITEGEIEEAMKNHFGGRMIQRYEKNAWPKTIIHNDLLDALKFFKKWLLTHLNK